MKDLSERRVLVVDDVRSNIDLLVSALSGEYKVSVALDGEAALRSIQKNPPDLVLLDVVMPGMSGYDVCRRLRSEPATRDLPVMFLTALDEVKDKMAGFEAGGTDYVTKPFEMLEVKARVKSLLLARAYQEAREEAMQRELKIARQIQMGLVTTDFLRWSGPGSSLDVHGLLEPARGVGGDLYAIYPLDERRVFLFVGDVSGKGIPAALYMSVANALLRTFSKSCERPEEVIARVNAELSDDNRSGMFVTLLVGILDLPTGKLLCASGGHTAPVLVRPGEAPRFALGALGTIVGVFGGSKFTGAEVQLSPGDLFVAYTDGVTEAFDPGGELFGDDRLLAWLGGAGGAGAARPVALGLLDEVRRFANGAAQSDDIAILALRWAPPA